MYNHSYYPNAHYSLNTKNNTFQFYAIKDIPANTEITINYNGAPNSKSKLWFEVYKESLDST
jgi:SET domain-containing protein